MANEICAYYKTHFSLLNNSEILQLLKQTLHVLHFYTALLLYLLLVNELDNESDTYR